MAGRVYSTEKIDIEKLLKRAAARDRMQRSFKPPSVYSNLKPNDDLKSQFFDPLAMETNYYGGIRTISPYYGRLLTPAILRLVAEKCWIINICISTSIKQARPFLKESTGENQRGFRIKNLAADKAGREMNEKEKKESEQLVDFLLNTGDVEDPNRVDDMDGYSTKIIRDLYHLDQISTELQRTKSGELCAFWAVDTATIEVALPNQENIKYAQVIDSIPYAWYTKDDLIYDCMNPRTDIKKAGYGYSLVEQCIELVTSAINTFHYNAGFFTENKLPRGMILINGDLDDEDMQDMQEWIISAMSVQPGQQWHVPIIPSGKTKGSGSGKTIDWVNLQGSNKDMEFDGWFKLQLSAIVAMFAKSMEELNLPSTMGQSIFAANAGPKMDASKSLGLGDLLSFLQKHFNKIIQIKNPAYCFEFVGYEKDDMKMVADIDKAEVDTWKTLNEKRMEKGLEPIDLNEVENAFDIPMGVQAVQLYQSKQGMGGMGGGFGGEDDEEGAEDEEDGGGWDEMENNENEDGEESDTEGGGWDTIAGKEDGGESSGDSEPKEKASGGWDTMGKSLGGTQAARVTL